VSLNEERSTSKKVRTRDELVDLIFDDAAHIKSMKMNSDVQHASLAHELQS